MRLLVFTVIALALASCRAVAAQSEYSAAPVPGTNFTIVKNEEFDSGREYHSRHLHILVHASEFSADDLVDLVRLIESDYPQPDRLTLLIYTDPRQYPTDLFSERRSAAGGSPFYYDYPGALVVRQPARFVFRVAPAQAPRTLVTYVFDRNWKSLPADGV